MTQLEETVQTLTRLQGFVAQANTTNSSSDKLEVIKAYPDLKRVFEYTLSEYKVFGITSDGVKDFAPKYKPSEWDPDIHTGLFDLLDDLVARRLTGQRALKAVLRFVLSEAVQPFEALVYNIIDKNLKTRTDATQINKVFPGCVPTFDVALADSYDGNESRVLFTVNRWFASHKLDGCRCLAIIDEAGEVTTWSRSGNQFETLKVLEADIKKLGLKNRVLDGEICLQTPDGKDDFQGVMKEIRRKDHQIKNPIYYIFDLLSLDDFRAKRSDSTLSVRLAALFAIKSTLTGPFSLPTLRFLDQTPVADKDHFEALRRDAAERGWEGLILRKDVPYAGKRTMDMLKVKDFHDSEYVVTGTVNGPVRMLVDVDADGNITDEALNAAWRVDLGPTTKQERVLDLLSSVTIEHRGSVVNVGSGFTMAQRRQWKDHPEEIIGKTITVQYFEETKNQEGGFSLRFPTFKGIREKE